MSKMNPWRKRMIELSMRTAIVHYLWYSRDEKGRGLTRIGKLKHRNEK
jgi:hypothetical protein